jgi:hypothetical protein
MFLTLSLSALFLSQAPVPAAETSLDGAQDAADLPQDLALRPPELVAGEPPSFELAAADDCVPLPTQAIYTAGDDGDSQLAPASGDPFFLGFAAGAYFPPDAESIDPDLAADLQSAWTDGRPAQETYAFVMFAKRITDARVAALEELGARVLGFHPHYCLKVALAPHAVDAVASLEFVRWVGVPKAWQKVHPALAPSFAALREGELAEVWINVYDSDLCDASTSRSAAKLGFGGPDGSGDLEDTTQSPRVWTSNGWQQRALEALGVQVVEYSEGVRAFRARIVPAAIEFVTALDFVQFVEPLVAPTLHHDESMPMILADRARMSYDANSVVVGAHVDSGLEYSHDGIGSFYWSSVNYTGESAVDDLCGHGTHVAGTFHGDGDVEDSYEGVADGLGWGAAGRYRIVKHFSGASCSWSGTSLATVMSGLHGSFTDSGGYVTPRPHVVNHSWGTNATSSPWIGTEVDPREVDAEVYTYGQLHVFSAGNDGSVGGTVSQQGVAKNAFTVGNVLDYYISTVGDPGTLWTSSSRGPAGDNRWKPNVCAPGRYIRSADASSQFGYVDKSGTSMAAPHVSGLAATLCEHYSFLRYNPSTLGAVLMATAMTKDGFLHGAPSSSSTHHLNTYGAGRIEAAKAHLMAPGTALYFWGWTQGTSSMGYVDMTVGSGATQLVVCLFYVEPASSSGASQALVNDLDLWIDKEPITAGATGEYYGHQSTINNVEIRSLANPTAGAWRIKVNPDSATTNSSVGVCAFVAYGDTTPDGTLTVTASDDTIKPNQNVVITASVSNPSYVASAVFLDSTSSGDTLIGASMVHEDGATANLLGNQHNGRDILLGDILAGDSRTATWSTRWATEGQKVWSVNARSDNWVDEWDSVTIYVDGTPPPVPTNLTSTTHTPGVWSNNPNISFSWSQPADNISGMAGYSWSLTNGLATLPDTVMDIGVVGNLSTTLPGTQGIFAFNLRPVDQSGNWQTNLTYTGFYPFETIAPLGPSGLDSLSHDVGVQSCVTTVGVQWSPASDADSGLAGYLGVWDTSPTTNPTGATNIGAGATSYGTNIGSSTAARWFHLRAKDVAGNYGTTQHFGPIYANANSVSTYCTGKVNSLGCTPSISSVNQPSKGAGNFTVTCSSVINNKFGLLFWGYGPLAAPFQGGFKCVADPVVRTPIQDSGGTPPGVDDCSGAWAFTFDTAYMNAYGIAPGDTLYAQGWGRDPASASTTTLSNALTFTVCE